MTMWNRHQVTYSSELLPPEPSSKNYWLEKGFKDLKATINGSFERDKSSITKLQLALENNRVSTSSMWMRLAKSIFLYAGIISIFIFAFVVTFAISIVHSAVVLVIMLIVYALLTVARALDGIYRSLWRLSFRCDWCKNTWSQPGYVCPSCGRVHARLRPNVYGILHHRCECGQSIPCTFFTTAKDSSGTQFRRSSLAQRCPNPGCRHEAHKGEFRPISIVVAGSRSVGKTAYISALSHQLVADGPNQFGYEVELVDSEKTALFRELERNYSSGTTDMTVESTDLARPSAFSLSFIVSCKGMSPSRMMHIYDIAGETFLRSEEHEVQLQYSYAEGVILIIDPMAIPEVADELAEELSSTDYAAIASAYPDTVVSCFVEKAKHVMGLGVNDKIRFPLAIVINKIDQAGLESNFAGASQETYKQKNLGCPKQDIEDALVREFLRGNGMGNLLNMVVANFANHRFFIASAMGHEARAGSFAPRGVMEPVGWILSQQDSKLATAVGCHVEYAKIPFAIDPMREQKNRMANDAHERAKKRLAQKNV